MKAVVVQASESLPLETVLGRMMHANAINDNSKPVNSWSTDQAYSWFRDVTSALAKQRGRTPLENYAKEKFSIVPTPQVAAGVKLESGVVILTTGYLDYLSFIATHVSAMQYLRKNWKKVKALDQGGGRELLSETLNTLTRFHVAISLGHLEGWLNCADILRTIETYNLKTEIYNRHSNWILFTLLHEIGHLDLFRRNISIAPEKEELYCDAFALKGWHADAPLIGYVGDVLVLFTYQWPIDLRYHGRNTHPPTFYRARMMLDTMNINGIFDKLKASLETGFWSKGDTLIGQKIEKRMGDAASLRYGKELIGDRYSEAVNRVFRLSDSPDAQAEV